MDSRLLALGATAALAGAAALRGRRSGSRGIGDVAASQLDPKLVARWASRFEHASERELRAEDLDWSFAWVERDRLDGLVRTFVPSSQVRNLKQAWRTFIEQEISADPGYYDAMRAWWRERHDRDTKPIYVVADDDGTIIELWDGWHRTGFAYLDDYPRLPAFVGRRRSGRGTANGRSTKRTGSRASGPAPGQDYGAWLAEWEASSEGKAMIASKARTPGAAVTSRAHVTGSARNIPAGTMIVSADPHERWIADHVGERVRWRPQRRHRLGDGSTAWRDVRKPPDYREPAYISAMDLGTSAERRLRDPMLRLFWHHVPAQTQGSRASEARVRVVRQLPEAEVLAEWARLYLEGKHAGYVQRAPDVHRGRSATWVEVEIPHDLYDADWNTEEASLSPHQETRARDYAARSGRLPPGMALFPARRRRSTRAWISDGNHRAYASWLRGEPVARFYMPRPDYDRFVAAHQDRLEIR